MIKQMIVVFIKEMKCIFRDKRTFLFNLIVPFLLVPVMLMIIDYSMRSSQSQVISNVNIGINNKENLFYYFCKGQENITILDVDNIDKSLESSEICAYIKVGDDLDKKIMNSEDFDIEVIEGDASINSVISTLVVNTYVDVFKNTLIPYAKEKHYNQDMEKLKNAMLNVNISKYVNDRINQQNDSVDTSSLYFNMLVPMMLILYCCIGSSSVASDISAGEKERGTIEPLLSTGADRTAIILGKLLATTIVGVLSGLCTTLGLWGYLSTSSSKSSVSLSGVQFSALIIITLFTAMFFAAVNLTLGVYARSYKEAQTYFMPVSIISLLPTYFTYTLDVSNIKIDHMFIPILNVVCVIKEIFGGAVNGIHLLIVLISLIIYIAIACCLMLKIFKKEEIVFRV